MTVYTTDSLQRFTITTDGVTASFPFGFKFLDDEDLTVSYIGTSGVRTLVLGTDYTLTGEGDEKGGTVTTIRPLPVGTLVVAREMLPTQETSLRNQGPFLSQTIETAFDRVTMLVQQAISGLRNSLQVDKTGLRWDFKGLRGVNLANPVEAQDAVNLASMQQYVGQLVSTGQGSLNSAANVLFVFPDGVARTLQDLSNKTDPSKGLRGIGYRGRDAWVALNYLGVSPMDFGAPGSGLTDALPALTLAIAEAKSKRIPLNIDAFFATSGTAVVENANGFLIRGTGTVRNLSSSASFVLDIRNSTAVTLEGDVIWDGNSSTNLSAAVRVAAIGSAPGGGLNTCSLHHLKINAINAPVGLQIGDFSAPDNLISEIKIKGYTYNTPVGAVVIGSQAVIDFTGMDLVAAGQGVFASYTHSLIINHGGSVTGVGSEFQMPGVSNGLGLVSCPIDSPDFTNKYGSFAFAGCQIECASLHFFAYNPRNVPTPEPGTGGMRLNTCYGYASFPGALYQDAAGSGFSGSIIVDDTNEFFANAIRTQPIAVFQNGAKVKVSDEALNDNFYRDLKNIGGSNCVALFDHRQIFEAISLGGASIPAASNFVFAFTSIPQRDNNSHFFGSYSTTSGLFTVPTGGLKSVKVQVNFQNGQPTPASALQVLVGGALAASCGANSSYVNGSFELGDLPQGTQIVIRFYNAGPAFSAAGGSQDRLIISARR